MNNTVNVRHLTHYVVLYPQNGDRIVPIDSVTSLHPMCTVEGYQKKYFIKAGRLNIIYVIFITITNRRRQTVYAN